MLTRILVTALVAGFVAGVVVSAAQAIHIVPLIHHAESFESAGGDDAAGVTHVHEDGSAHHHDHEGGVERVAFTVLANVLLGVGFAFLLVAAIALSGRAVDWRRGLLWGLAGFAVFGIAPAIGLPPVPPGVDAGPVESRQAWWILTAGATATGLALIVFGRHWALKALGIAALALPHLVGAPFTDVYGGATPDEVIDGFIVASLVPTGVFWLILGLVSGWLFPRVGRATAPA